MINSFPHGRRLGKKKKKNKISSKIQLKKIKSISPWWLVETKYGTIKIGWRKRVIEIDWSATDLRKIIHNQDITKTETMIHAYGYAVAITYLYILFEHLSRIYVMKNEWKPEDVNDYIKRFPDCVKEYSLSVKE